MPCDCHRENNVEIQHRTLVLLLAINATMFCLEVAAGILANSTALLADSLDMFADATIYGIALYAVGKPHFAKRRAAFASGILQGILVRKRTLVAGYDHGGSCCIGSERQLSMASSEAAPRRSSH